MPVQPSGLPRRGGRRIVVAVAAALFIVASSVPMAGGVFAASRAIDVQLPLGHHISGVITAPSGQPVAGARVDASGDIGSTSALSGADGSYVIHGLPNGAFRLLASLDDDTFAAIYYGVPGPTPDYWSASLVTVDGADPSGIDIRFAAKAATGISGTIRDPDGHPVVGVRVQALGDAGSGQALTGTDGTYRIDGLPAGDYRLFVSIPDGSPFLSGPYVNGAVGGQGDEPSLVTVADLDTANIDAVLVRGKTISGHVTSARPAAITATANGPGFGKATVDSAGNYLIQGLAPGVYHVMFRDVVPGPVITEAGNFAYGSYGPGGSLVGQDAALAIDVSSADAVLDPVRIPRGTDIVGQVTDGKVGLGNAYLFVCDPSGILGCASATGRPDGTFRIVHVPSGSFQIFASAPGRVAGFYQTNGFTVDDAAASPVKVVSGGPDIKGIRIAIPAGGIVTGRITGPANEPITGAKVSVYPIGLPPNALQPVSGPDGTFRQTGIPNNEYGLSVEAPAGTDYQSGFYLAGAPGNYTGDVWLAGTFRAVEDHDRVAPTITFRDPAAGATGVGVDTAISVRFSEPVEGISSSTMQLRDPRGRIVPGSVTFTAFDRSARLTPTGALLPGTKYRLTLTPGIVDWSGNRFAGTSWTFTTTP